MRLVVWCLTALSAQIGYIVSWREAWRPSSKVQQETFIGQLQGWKTHRTSWWCTASECMEVRQLCRQPSDASTPQLQASVNRRLWDSPGRLECSRVSVARKDLQEGGLKTFWSDEAKIRETWQQWPKTKSDGDVSWLAPTVHADHGIRRRRQNVGKLRRPVFLCLQESASTSHWRFLARRSRTRSTRSWRACASRAPASRRTDSRRVTGRSTRGAASRPRSSSCSW